MAHIGIYNLNMNARGGGERSTAVMAEHFSRRHTVSLICNSRLDLAAIGTYFNADLSKVRLVVLRELDLRRFGIRTRVGSRSIVDTLQSASVFVQLRALKVDVFINNAMYDTTPNPGRHGIYMCMFPTQPQSEPTLPLEALAFRIRRLLVGSPRDRIKTYNVITAVSRFTARWTSEWWKRGAAVIYSAPEDMGPPLPKEKIILHVARFTAVKGSNHAKRQEVLLSAFLQMQDLIDSGWELHFAGSAEHTPDGEKFLSELRTQAGNSCVYFHLDATADELRNLYRRASLYWHATGFGVDQEEFPSQQEHLGLTAIEAMSAGCIPVVINAGGLSETVSHGNSGFLWNDLGEMADYTRRLAFDPELCEGIGTGASRAARQFSKELFVRRMDHIVETLLTGGTVDPNDFPDFATNNTPVKMAASGLN